MHITNVCLYHNTRTYYYAGQPFSRITTCQGYSHLFTVEVIYFSAYIYFIVFVVLMYLQSRLLQQDLSLVTDWDPPLANYWVRCINDIQ